MDHFKGKSAFEHVVEARLRGKMASSEIHGAELPGHISAGADAAKETAFIILILHGQIPLLIFLFAFCLWKTGRSAILGWSRLERMHRVIEEERWEIEHYRPQEKEELKALYAAKGLSGKLLDDVIDVLMNDDNRLLQIMLEEELGFNLESLEHPLKQALGAFVGVILAAAILIPMQGSYTAAGLIIALSAGITAKFSRNKILPAIVWNLSLAFFALLATHFFTQFIS